MSGVYIIRDFKGQFVFSGNCERLLGDLAEGFWNSRNYELRMKLYNDGGDSGEAWNFDLLKVYFMGDYKQLNEYTITITSSLLQSNVLLSFCVIQQRTFIQ